MTSPLGYMIQAQGVSDRAALLAHLQAVQPTTLTVMDDYQLAVQIRNMLLRCIVVYRSSTFEPAPDYSNEAIRNWLSAFPDKRIVLMINCEAGFDSSRVSMWVRFITIASGLGYKLCVGNISSGSVKCGQGADVNEWLTVGAPLLRAFVTNPGHYLAFHEYTFPFAWSVSNGAFGEPNHPPSQLNWTLPQWHIGRNVQGIQAACKTLNIAPPQCIVTECLIDTMNDISTNKDSPFYGMKADGYKTLSDYWNKVYPGQDHGDVLADNQIWAWEKAYAPCGFVVGVHVYCWGDASGGAQKWYNYRVDDNPRYLQRMEAYTAAAQPVAPTLPPVVTPPPVTNPPDNSVAIKALIEEILNQLATVKLDMVNLTESVLKLEQKTEQLGTLK